MTDVRASSFLHRALVLDAAATGGTALLLALGAGFLDGALGLHETLLRGAGVILVPFVALVAWAATRADPPAQAIRAIIALNGAWAAGSVVLLVSGWIDPTLLGYAFVIGQALVFGIFAELQVIGLRRARAVAA